MDVLVFLAVLDGEKQSQFKANFAGPRGVEQYSEAGCRISIIFRKKEEM